MLETYAWTFTDAFVIILAIGITYRLCQFQNYIEKHLMNHEGLMASPLTWRKLRVDFVQLIELIYFIDSWISLSILITLGHNMLLIVLKIFNAFM